jgi:hypothetical protein
MNPITRRSAIAGAVFGSFASLVSQAKAEGAAVDTTYAPQFRAGTQTGDVVEFVYSLTCPDCATFYRQKLQKLLRQVGDGQPSTIVFHNLVRSQDDLEFSTEVLLTDRYPEFCLSILERNAASGKIMSLQDMLHLRETLQFALRENADKSRARYSLALLNKYALEKLSIHQTPTIFRNRTRVSNL